MWFAARVAPALALTAPALALTGCAGGMPLLHPAKTLSKGDVRAVAGLSGEAIAANYSTALQNALKEAGNEGNAPPDVAYARGALVAAAVNPGIAPFVSARVGIGDDFEGGLTYTGRSARIDFRRAGRRGGAPRFFVPAP